MLFQHHHRRIQQIGEEQPGEHRGDGSEHILKKTLHLVEIQQQEVKDNGACQHQKGCQSPGKQVIAKGWRIGTAPLFRCFHNAPQNSNAAQNRGNTVQRLCSRCCAKPPGWLCAVLPRVCLVRYWINRRLNSSPGCSDSWDRSPEAPAVLSPVRQPSVLRQAAFSCGFQESSAPGRSAECPR